MNGRIYRVPAIKSYPTFGKWPDGTLFSLGHTDHEVFRDLVVPNGTWVMEGSSYRSKYSWLIGIGWEDIRDALIDERPLQERLLWMADKPFGFIEADEAEYLPGPGDVLVPKGPRRLMYAEQIHKGEIGQGTPIPRLKFTREHPENARKMHNFPRNRDQRRNPHRWARLSEVVAAADVSAHTLLKAGWPFMGRTHDPSRDKMDLFLHVRFGQTVEDISAQQELPTFLAFEELGKRIMGGQSLDEMWIRAGLANTLLRLHALGYEPLATV